MPKFGPFLANIEKKIERLIEILELTADFRFKKETSYSRFYTTPCINSKRQRLFFKVRIENYHQTRKSFKNEIKAHELLGNINNKFLIIPKNLDSNTRCVPEWVLREYTEGEQCGDMCGFDKKKLEIFPITKFMKALKFVQSLSNKAKKQTNNFKKTDYLDFKNNFLSYKNRLSPFFSDDDIKKASFIFKEHRELLNRKCNVLAHGDLHPGNIIIDNKSKRIAIIDWSYIQFNNIVFDFTFLYLESWISPAKRKELLKQFIKIMIKDKDEFRILFRLNILRLAPQMINILKDRYNIKKDCKIEYSKKIPPIMEKALSSHLSDFKKAIINKNFI